MLLILIIISQNPNSNFVIIVLCTHHMICPCIIIPASLLLSLRSNTGDFLIQRFLQHQETRGCLMSKTVFIPDNQSWISMFAVKKYNQFGLKPIFRGKQLAWQVVKKDSGSQLLSIQTRWQEIIKLNMHFPKEQHLNPIFLLQLVH